MAEMKGISCCGDCIYYDFKRHLCIRGYNKETDPQKPFYDDCPLPDVKPVVHAHWQKYDDSEFCYCSYCGKPSAEDDNVSWHGYCPICGATMDEELERLNCGAQMDEEINNG